jgi:hypothetical protein
VGLTICTQPYWLILVTHDDPSQDAGAAQSLINAGEFLRTAIRQFEEGNNPVLVPRDPNSNKPWQSISTAEAAVDGDALDEALSQLFGEHPQQFELWMFSYGMKMPLAGFWDVLRDMWAAAPPGHMASAMDRSLVDLAIEVGTEGDVLLSLGEGQLRTAHLYWLGAKLHHYPLFGRLGGNFGGIHFKAGQDSTSLHSVCVYPGAWKHALFRVYRAKLQAPARATQGFYYEAGKKLKSAMDFLASWHAPLGGCRIEVRCKFNPDPNEIAQTLAPVFRRVCSNIQVLPISKASILEQANNAYTAAADAGLFVCTGGVGQRAPGWKRKLYHRLIASLGYGHKFINWMAYRCALEPWVQPVGGDGGVEVGPGHPQQPPPELGAGHAAGPQPPVAGEQVALTSPHLQPHILELVAEEDLTAEEHQVFSRLPNKQLKGGKWTVYYKPPWGGPGPAPKSKGYWSKAALARAVWAWAGPQWEERVKL